MKLLFYILDLKFNLPQLLWIRALWKNVFDTVVSAIHQQKTLIIVRVIFSFFHFSVADVRGYRPVNTYGLINVYPKSGGER